MRLVWRKRRWIYTDPDCDAKCFTEQAPQIEGALTRRTAMEICRKVGEDVHSVTQVARASGVGWAMAMARVRRQDEALDDRHVAWPGNDGGSDAVLDWKAGRLSRGVNLFHTKDETY